MKHKKMLTIATILGVLVAAGGMAISAQDKYTVKVPGGLAFSEFRGYEFWQYVATSESDDRIKIIGGNPLMIAAYRAGFPANGKPVPDGAVLSKIQWSKNPNPGFPVKATAAGDLKEVEFMVKDSKRFADSNGWGYAQFNYDTASRTFTPLGTGTNCGTACHNAAAKKDYVFTEYSLR
jgi:hypothetical protein